MARTVPLAVTRDMGRLQSWLARAALPQALVGTRAELAWALVWMTAVAAAAVADVVAPRPMSMGVLASLPVLAASWMLGGRGIAAVLGALVAVETAAVVLGEVSGAGFAARVLTMGLVALAGRAAAVSVARLQRARRKEAIAEVAEVEQRLLDSARLLAEARQLGQAKNAFLNQAAHELRTPLAVIKGYLSLLEDGTYPVPDRTRVEVVDTLVAKAQELESLVEALLTTARLDVGTPFSSRTELDLGQCVRDAEVRLRPRARLEGARVDVRLPADDLWAPADRGQVARILDNLLNNALTYSVRPATVEIEVRPGPPVEVAVRDGGHGIPAEQHEQVFEPFYRGGGSASRFSPGLGLGLSISRELAQLNGGALFLEESVPGHGSVFVLRLAARAVPLSGS